MVGMPQIIVSQTRKLAVLGLRSCTRLWALSGGKRCLLRSRRDVPTSWDLFPAQASIPQCTSTSEG